jgi:hypothetical protein
MPSLFVVEDLHELVVARLAALALEAGDDDPLPALFGARHLEAPAGLAPNTYLWVPLRELKTGFEKSKTESGHDSLWGRRHHFQVRCYGESHAIASQMLENVTAAIWDVAEDEEFPADVDLIGATWFEADGTPPAGDGECLIAEFTVIGTFPRRYVHVARRVRAAQTPSVVDAPTVQPTGFAFEMHSTRSTTADGEDAGPVVVTFPTP